MADPVPVCDVLCEATEYLSKLGSNLRMRTDNLKEKRIRKDKLKNAHAVQKAINKVLLICELSKKSIENVETGVKKILAQIGANQAEQDSDKSYKSPKTKNNDAYEHFTYDSKKLKVRKKINVKHYLSSKVLLNSIPMDVLDKYPVYEKCKLYYARKYKKASVSKNSDFLEVTEPENREQEMEKSSIEQSSPLNQSVHDSSVIQIDSSFNETCVTDSEDKDTSSNAAKSKPHVQNKESNLIKDRESSILLGDNSQDQGDLNDTSRISNKDDHKVKAHNQDSKFKKMESCDSKAEMKTQENFSNFKGDKISDDKNDTVIEESDSEKESSELQKSCDEINQLNKKHSLDSKNKSKHIKTTDDLSSESSKEEKLSKKINKLGKSTNDIQNEESSNKKRFKHVINMDDSSESNQSSPKVENSLPETVCMLTSFSENKPEHDKSLNLNSDEKINENVEAEKTSLVEKISECSEKSVLNDTECLDPSKAKPLIKCVSINKLLKEDLIQKKDESLIELTDSDNENDSNTKNKFKNSSKTKEKTMKNKSKYKHQSREKRRKKQDSSADEEECYWLQKRIEVKNFKAKKFSIKVGRLPIFTANYLTTHNLRKIVQNELVLYEIDNLSKESEKDGCGINKSIKGLLEKKDKTGNIKSDVSLAKNQLLFDSDSDKSTKTLNENVTEIVKQALLNDSDSDQQTGDNILNSPLKESLNLEHNDNEQKNEENDKTKELAREQPLQSDNESADPKKNGSISKDLRAKKFGKNDSTHSSNSSSDDGSGKKNENMNNIEMSKNDLKNCDNSTKSSQSSSNLRENIISMKMSKSKENETNVCVSELQHEKDIPNNIENVNTLDNDAGGNNSHLSPNKENVGMSDNGKGESDTTVCPNSSEGHKAGVSEFKDAIEKPETKNKSKCLEIENSPTSSREESDKKIKNSDSEKKDENSPNDNLITSDTDANKTKNDEGNADKQSLHGDSDPSNESVKESESSPIKHLRLSTDSENGYKSEVAPNSLPNEKESETVKDSETIEQTKSSLLKDSSDELKTSYGKRKRSKSESISPSKRKNIMESMHAKKMLLTYSSSSDTDDEQLKSVLKEIRDSLLKGSDDEKRRSVSSASESEKNTKRPKRKTKHESKKEKSENVDDSSQSRDSRSTSSTKEKSSSSSKKMGGHNNAQDSSCQNSDTQDDKDIDGLTNLKTLNKKKRTRRTSTSTTSTRSTRSRVKKEIMPKVISEENFLKAETSSDAQSASESDAGVEEDVPEVTVTGLNGDGISHLAKDDLLEESDSSNSEHDKEDVKQEHSSDEDNVKARRRKANTISSDSEAGSARKKDKTVKLSDFEDSECESSEPVKKVKRKKKGSDSDASVSSSVDGSKKRRKRIKTIDDSDGSGSETENEGKNKHGRKNIRKVMGKNQLEEATKKAAREEKERIARIAERQKLYNNLEFDESGKPDEVVLEKVVLDFDPETKEPLIQVDPGLVKKLKPHQANGIKFMWNACFESVKRIKKDKGSGCILAHCMGLGKTLQVVSLTHTLLSYSELTKVNRVLVVCPLSTVLNWVNEFKMWLKHTTSDFEVDVYELSRYKQNSERAFQLNQWFQGGGVCVLGYEMFRNLSADNVKKFKKKMLRNFQESLVDPGPDLVVCDEGHLLKNEKTSLSQAMNRIKTLRRIVLTGTPLQNNLKEYYCMVQFVKPNLLGKYNEYLNRFVNPITNGQYTDSTEHDIRVMKRRSHVLHKMLDGAVQRRDYGVLAPFLPPKHEYVLFITLTEIQIKLYQHYLDNYSRRPLPGKSSGFLFPDFQSLQRIWTHPLVLKYNSERYEIMQQKKREREEEDSEGSLADFIDDDSTPEESTTEESTDDGSDASDDSRKKSKKKKSNKKSKGKVNTRRGTRANPVETEAAAVEEDVVVPEVEANPTEWWIRLVADDELEDLRHSHKLVLLFDILRQCEAIGDKLLVFSQSLYSLDLIEHFLGKVDEATQEGRVDEKLNGHVGSWSPGIDYFRLDGSTSCENRSIWCKNFNREDNPRARLFLISTRAGGLGINLVAANRVVIFDVSWNPSHDVQSIFRVYRFGQKKPCYVYRFLAMGTMEEKIYERQVTKQAISKRVIDEQQIDRHYAENDLAELYKFEPSPPPREIPPLPKDRLFAEMLKDHEAQIYKYHEHDSLLENKEEETLTEEERKAAWEDFENEKTRPPPTPFVGAYMHNGMMPGLLAQQQQQLAYAALAAMLRKDMPNINDQQIRDMLPLVYNANPGMFGGYDYGLLQKMNEIYKYAQPSMMNPGMMNPMMNPAAGGMGMGGSSGLQYEPPWQRQQQQQQQMRLQQLMQQQQNQMGAKYYAGGLGSRDPVAMALQQQRAREMMLGERARPRGRPPAPRPPRPPGPDTGAHDVVNLDSD